MEVLWKLEEGIEVTFIIWGSVEWRANCVIVRLQVGKRLNVAVVPSADFCSRLGNRAQSLLEMGNVDVHAELHS